MTHRTNVEVDQSGKVGVFTDDTVIAFSDHIAHTILIPARVKRAAIKFFDYAESIRRLLHSICSQQDCFSCWNGIWIRLI